MSTPARPMPIEGADPRLYNADLGPTSPEARSWSATSMAALWVGMVVCVPTYMLAASMIEAGMSWWQAVLAVLLGNVIVLVPMTLVGHAGTKHGVPFPVLLRSSFGTVGANVPALLRGLVACGWFGIQTWIGGAAIYTLLQTLTGLGLHSGPLPVVGINAWQLCCFLAFWALHVFFIARGTESIRWLETLAAPFLLVMGLALLFWAYAKAGGFGEMLKAPSQFGPGQPKEGQLWSTFFPCLTAMVGFWATLSLNIPDFTRYCRTQRAQMLGQAIGLPPTMALFAFIGVAVTSATVVLYGRPIWDPVELLGKMGGASVVVALLALTVATLTTNLAANVVAPANGFSNLSPSRISYKMGGYITAGIGIAIFPWKLLASAGAYIFTWLIGYSALLGPIAGILIVDYYVIRRTELDVPELFRRYGHYSYRGGWNPRAIAALVLGVIPNLPGFLYQVDAIPFRTVLGPAGAIAGACAHVYTYAWFVGLLVSGGAYWLLMRHERTGCGRFGREQSR